MRRWRELSEFSLLSYLHLIGLATQAGTRLHQSARFRVKLKPVFMKSGGHFGDARDMLVLQAHSHKNVPQPLDAQLLEEFGSEIDREAAFEPEEIPDQGGAIHGSNQANELFNLR
jgi:hypothetical protein